jgi:DNA-binding transcriptional ArsR family regulator
MAALEAEKFLAHLPAEATGRRRRTPRPPSYGNHLSRLRRHGSLRQRCPGMPLDWDKLRVFHAVAEAGSFTHAGETLNLSQSAVSRQIQALEEALRCRCSTAMPAA